MQDRLDALSLNKYNFLWPEELNLAQRVLKLNEKTAAWTEDKRGRFHDEYFSLVKIPTIELSTLLGSRDPQRLPRSAPDRPARPPSMSARFSAPREQCAY